ncbi:MAG: tRNA pseudouridine(55) synthase TruB [Victivallales bacterium]|nr:tRNA pseudouridine(55) synthase TruB [Victivallales bacterium]
MPRLQNVVDGILLVDKPQDWTSSDVVCCVRGRFHLSKVGHCGTLDPLATGLLILLLGKATRLQDRLMGEDKVYEGSLRLGVETDTEDVTGQEIARHDASSVSLEALCMAAQSFLGEIEQIPPMVSAIKKDGRPLYKLARKGVTIEREPRKITIRAFDIQEANLPDASYRVACSKGTYIRTLCADLGRKLGCGAIMTALRRTHSGRFDVADAVTMEQIKSFDLEALRQAVLPLERVLEDDALRHD